MLRLVVHLFVALITVAVRRVQRGPQRPSWSFGFEVLVTALRVHARWLAELDIAALRRVTESMRGPLAPGVSVRTDHLGAVPVTWFEPSAETHRTVLYLHGGGYVFGSAAQDRALASQLASELKARVVAPDYRLAPEAPFPAAVEDVVATFDELREAGHSDIVLIGLSSGAGLAVTALTRLRKSGVALPTLVVLLSPMLDATGTSSSCRAYDGVDWGVPSALVRWAKLYASPLDLAAPELSPVHAELAGLPPTLVVNGEVELLSDDARRFVDRAKGAAVEVTHHVERDMIHAFMALGRNDQATTRTFEQIRRFVALHTPGTPDRDPTQDDAVRLPSEATTSDTYAR